MEWDGPLYLSLNLGTTMPEGRIPMAENKKGKGEEMRRGGGMAKEAWGGWKREGKD